MKPTEAKALNSTWSTVIMTSNVGKEVENRSFYAKTNINTVKRLPKRAIYDKEIIHGILKQAIFCFVGFDVPCLSHGSKIAQEEEQDGKTEEKNINEFSFSSSSGYYPCVIPTLFGISENGEYIYFHGSAVNRMLNMSSIKNKERDIPMCATVAILNAFVLAKSAFHHSCNYESVAIFGHGEMIETKDEKLVALKIISDHVLPERWKHTRLPTDKELNSTAVIRMRMVHVSGKVRNAPPTTDKNEEKLEFWSGLLPIGMVVGKPAADECTRKQKLEVPMHIQLYQENIMGRRTVGRDDDACNVKQINGRTKLLYSVVLFVVVAIGVGFVGKGLRKNRK